MFAKDKMITLRNKIMPYLAYNTIMMHKGGITEMADNCICKKCLD